MKNATEYYTYNAVSDITYTCKSAGIVIVQARTWKSNKSYFYFNDELLYTDTNPNTSYGVYYTMVFACSKGDVASVKFSNSTYNGTSAVYYFSYN